MLHIVLVIGFRCQLLVLSFSSDQRSMFFDSWHLRTTRNYRALDRTLGRLDAVFDSVMATGFRSTLSHADSKRRKEHIPSWSLGSGVVRQPLQWLIRPCLLPPASVLVGRPLSSGSTPMGPTFAQSHRLQAANGIPSLIRIGVPHAYSPADHFLQPQTKLQFTTSNKVAVHNLFPPHRLNVKSLAITLTVISTPP